MLDPGSVSLGTEEQSCNIPAVKSNPIIIALVVRVWSINSASLCLARSLPDSLINLALTHGQPRATRGSSPIRVKSYPPLFFFSVQPYRFIRQLSTGKLLSTFLNDVASQTQ